MAQTLSPDGIIREILAMRRMVVKLSLDMHVHGVVDCPALDEVDLGLKRAQSQFLAAKAERDARVSGPVAQAAE